ncbi:MAG: hypothetical protein JXC32_22515 [Anaerolineae bacterium]|nr:hypothetical protein [Anaerolineae bacterium]
MQLEPAELDALLAWGAEGDVSCDLERLVRQAAMVCLAREASARAYAPGARYGVGERVWYQGQVAEVAAVHSRGNPAQGLFAILELSMSDGTVLRALAEAHGAPRFAASPETSGDRLTAFLDAHASELRTSLLRDPRLAALISQPGADVAMAVSVGPEVRTPVRASSMFRADALGAEVVTGAALQPATGDAPMAVAAGVSRTPEDTGLRARYNAVRAAFIQVTGGLVEQQTWTHFVAPTVSALGWAYVPLPNGAGFALFPDAAIRDRAVSQQPGISLLKNARALLQVERWGSSLGEQLAGEEGVAKEAVGSPALRLVGRLLSEGVAWGILTNGREWRLYSSAWGDPDVGSTLGTFHGVDLSDILGLPQGAEGPTDAQLQRFGHWIAVFGPDASTPDNRGRTIIDSLKRESSAYARSVVRDLRRRLLESVVPEIAGGFVAYRTAERGANTETDETLDEIARASLGLVYRLLFVLHAEQHGMLPMSNPDYRGESLTTMVRWARDRMEDGPLPSVATHVTPRYDGLLTLFHHLDQGHALLGLAEAGGRLFSPADPDTGFLERHRLSDRAVARTLSSLGSFKGEPVDFSVISMRHLSAVAEGLLESLLWVVEPAAGQVALISNRGEPQAPSSVPVPDFVGVSVIEDAIQSVLATRAVRFATAMDRVAILRRGEVNKLPERVALAAAERVALDALLGIKVLDPAMGTGTFLIAVIDTLVDGIAEALATYHRTHPWVPWTWDPVARTLVEARESILAATEAQGIVISPGSLEDDVVLSRLIAERAIYGVDLNQTAVALGRASVMMRAYVTGAPFIDVTRHIRRGDSLLGTRLAALRDEGLAPRLVAGLSTSGVMPEGDSVPVDTAPYEALLDLWYSESLGNAGARDLLSRLGDDAPAALRGALSLDASDIATLRRARELAEALGFLHWDVAFPEVFLEPDGEDEGQPGFDVIIGSPPMASPGPVAGRGEDGPFMARARQLVRRPGGRVAFVLTPSGRA